MNYEDNAKVFRALGDINRLQIVHLLSTKEKCACELLESFNFTQPTLSHHMKVLMECGLVKSRRNGNWNYYKLDKVNANRVVLFLMSTVTG